ncbi:MAG: TlyA family RNA methyltransferase, partial [Candidatus Marinimicrobia bacterium]|nr:TlyA family RNA methyltransferase [Candidatus Neomarinimicrobiota bacterium]
VAGAICLDVGASAGGFTDCLLQHGAAQVIAVDVGQGQLDWRLRQDARVTVIERLNARYLKEADLPARPSLAVIDVSFISLTLILPPVSAVLEPGGVLITLIKPQFEAGRDQVERGGVVRDPAVRQAVADRIRAFGEGQLGLAWRGLIESPLPGPAGNREWLAYWSKQGAMGTVPA